MYKDQFVLFKKKHESHNVRCMKLKRTLFSSICKCICLSCYNSTWPGSSDGRLGADLHAFLAWVTPDGDPAVSADTCTVSTSSSLPRTAPHSLSAPLAGQTGHQLMQGRSSGAGHSALSGRGAGGHLSQTGGWQIEPHQLCGDHLHEQVPGNRVMCGGDRYVGYRYPNNNARFSSRISLEIYQ